MDFARRSDIPGESIEVKLYGVRVRCRGVSEKALDVATDLWSVYD